MNTPRPVGYLLGIVAALALTVVLAVIFMRPPLEDLRNLALLFVITGSASAAIGFISHRLGWWRRLPSLTQTLTLGYVLAAALTLINVWITAGLMFINAHDLALAGVLLLFASGISVSFGYFLSGSITQALGDIVRGTTKVGEGDFSTRVDAAGQDEVAQLARAFNAMTERLEQADSDMRALDAARRDLVAWASHDLRTPLASLRAMLEALADGVVSDPETVARYLRQCQSEIRRMSTMTDDLFELAQLDSGHLALNCELASLADVISDTLEAFTARARAKGIHVNGSLDPDVDPVWMAPEKVSRVLQNLVENAIRHTPAGGEIQMRAAVRDGSVIITVRDSGEGIAPEDLPHIFERFYRGEKSRARSYDSADDKESFTSSGAGLGLAIARGLVEAHGGRIWAESAPGQGTEVKVLLPKTAPVGAGLRPGPTK